MGAPYVIMGLISDWYVRRSVSFWWPQVEPPRAFSILSRLEHLAVMDLTCGPKVKSGSKVTPRILGFMSSGRILVLIVT